MEQEKEQWPICRSCGNVPDRNGPNEWQITEWYEQEAECTDHCDDEDYDYECDCGTEEQRRTVRITIEHHNGQHTIKRHGQDPPHDQALALVCDWCGTDTHHTDNPNKIYMVYDNMLELLGELDYDWETREQMADKNLIGQEVKTG